MPRRDEWYAAYPGDVGPFFGFIVDPREAELPRAKRLNLRLTNVP